MSLSDLRASFAAGWERRRGPLRPWDVPGVVPWVAAIGLLALRDGAAAGRYACATLVVWGALRGARSFRGGLESALRGAATRLGEVSGLLAGGSLDRRAFRDMDEFDTQWDGAVDGVWAWWVAMLLGPVLVGWP